jgi:CRISPR-associated protein Csx10
MKQQWFELTTRSQVIVSSYGVTEGVHQSLDYIPGSAFIGVVSDLWGKLDEGLLIDGRLRISDALPYAGLQPELLFPVPLCYHKAKYEDVTSESKFFNGVHDLQKYQYMQLEQMRREFIAAKQCWYTTIPKSVAVKTALDRTQYGAALDGKLFTYESLPEGLVFRFRVEADDSVSDAGFDRVCNRLQQIVRIGRSRTAEYGSVDIVPITVTEHPAGAPVEWEQYPDHVVLYFISDYAGETPHGPNMIPSGPEFFLDSTAQVCWKSSYIRSRSYSPWNSHFQTRMPMRHVISKGSVLVFKTAETWSQEALQNLQDKLDAGIGSYINEGLGIVRVNPEFVITGDILDIYELSLEESLKNQQHPPATADINEKYSPLIQYLKNRVNSMNRAGEAKQLGLIWAKKWQKFMKALQKDNVLVPGKTQWSNLREIAIRNRLSSEKSNKNMDAFLAALKKHCTRPGADDPSHHRSTRHKYWITEILSRDFDGSRKSLSLYGQIIKDLTEDTDVIKREENMPGLMIDAFIQAIVEITRAMDRNDGGR